MRRFWVGCGLVVALVLFGRNALYGGLITLTNSTPGYFDNSSGASSPQKQPRFSWYLFDLI